MDRTVTFEGNPLTLVGRNIAAGMTAPDFQVVTGGLEARSLKDFAGKIKIVTSFPSIDTPVCDLQVKEFNKKAAELSEDVVVLGISKDLPFAQARFCDMNGIEKVTVLSDYKSSSFGINYGLLIKELNLLARSVMILDKNNVIRYVQLVKEITDSPNYEDVLDILKGVIDTPEIKQEKVSPEKCKACSGGVAAMDQVAAEKALAKYRGWELVDGKKVVKTFEFKDFVEAKYFVDLIAVLAEEESHHPDIAIMYNKVKMTLTTHAAKGLTDNDLIMATLIDGLE